MERRLSRRACEGPRSKPRLGRRIGYHAAVMDTLASTQEYLDTHRPAPIPYWRAYMNVDASLTEAQARALAFDDVKNKTGAASPGLSTFPAEEAAVPDPPLLAGAPEAKVA